MRFKQVALASSVLFSMMLTAQQPSHQFAIDNDKFVLDGKPFQVISGEMHYPRIPRAEWRARFRMAKAMGLNTITTYVFWNVHEPTPGVFDFSGNNDVAEFIREAQQQGLWVVLRPGPYVCAEWEFGGFPAWLLKGSGAKLRSLDPAYMDPSKRFINRLGKELAPLQAANGGPIIAIQVENEYGAWGSDRDYMRAVRQSLIDAGFTKTMFYSTDGPKPMANDIVPGMFSAVNFGVGRLRSSNITSEKGIQEAKQAIDMSKKLQPGAPVFVGEFWGGWFDHFDTKWEKSNGQVQADTLQWILQQGYSISIYMFHGGTSFGWMNGANGMGPGNYLADVTSYDYDAALPEDGVPGAKFEMFRKAIAEATGKTPPPIPAAPVMATLPRAEFANAVSLWDVLPKPQHSDQPANFEDLDQNYGYVLYRTHLPKAGDADLNVTAVHQYAVVYVDGKQQGIIDRRLGINTLKLHAERAGAQIDILVENTGRINHARVMQDEHMGLIGPVTFAGDTLSGWDIFKLPMDHVDKLKFAAKPCVGPCFYKAALAVSSPGPTYLDTRELMKGQMWVNGNNLGRFWSIGPQGSLYTPGSWLHSGKNDVIVFDLEAAPGRGTQGLSHLVTDLGQNAAIAGNE